MRRLCVPWLALLALAVAVAAGHSAKSAPSAPGRSRGKRALPVVVNTWPFTVATEQAWASLSNHSDVLVAVERGVAACERAQCDGTVGFGGSPDESGETTLDAMIMDGSTVEVGAVVDLRGVKDAIRTARLVMEFSNHTMLAGVSAAMFAMQMGVPSSSLDTNHSREIFREWQQNDCQPNYRRNVLPDPRASCGPYLPAYVPPHAEREAKLLAERREKREVFGRRNHDTIAMVAVDGEGRVVAGTSTNGANHKVPGRVGDSAIAGAGAYARSGVGGCGATGDGDVMMRFLPCYQAVESMRRGHHPKDAAEDAMARIREAYPKFQGALVVVDAGGQHAGATNCMDFSYSVASHADPEVQVIPVKAAVPC